jgi:NADPH:quinone reductase-like Zn-dependent oxidoreductase
MEDRIMEDRIRVPASMMALRAHRRGGPEQLVYEVAPVPTPAAGEVLVAVTSAAITFAELSWPDTWEVDGHDRTPIIPSHEFSGFVVELGPGVDDLEVGDPVFGLVPFDRDGAAAEFVTVPTNGIARRPDAVTDDEAAAAVLPALTAQEALSDHLQMSPGQRLLVRGGTGGVGAFATQLARRAGVEVTVTVPSSATEQYAKELGAHHVIVAADMEPGALHDFDAAIDAVGAKVPEWVYAAVRPGGRLVVLQGPPDQELAERYGVDARFFIVSNRREKLEALAALLSDGQIRAGIAETFALPDGRAAYESGTRPKPRPGKTVLRIS